MFLLIRGEMFLNKSQTPLVLLLVSGIILIVVSFYIINQKKPEVNEGFKVGKKKQSRSNSSKQNKRSSPYDNAISTTTLSANPTTT